jgi:hypothetical protein
MPLKPSAAEGNLMEAKFWKIAVSLGVPGFALAVFYKLYDKFDWPLASIESNRMSILVVIFMVIIAVIVIIALVIYRPEVTGEQIVHKYGRLKEGLSSPEQNVALIQEIANSTDPNKEKYLQEFMDFKNISFLELAATKLALEEVRKSKKVSRLFESAKQKERKNLSKIAGATGNQMLDAAIVGLKYWRLLNRRNHPQFSEVEAAIENSLSFKNPEQIVETLKKIQIEA